MRILVAIEAIDGRKGIDSLAQLCREKLRTDPFSGCMFFFRNRSAKANRMTLREGPGAIGAERLGRMSEGLHAALLQSNPSQPGSEPIVHVFPDWPIAWEAQFTLSARGGILVSSSFAQGAVEFVELRARVVTTCRLRNPWERSQAALFRNGRAAGSLHGEIFEIPTSADETLVVAPAGRPLASLKRFI